MYYKLTFLVQTKTFRGEPFTYEQVKYFDSPKDALDMLMTWHRRDRSYFYSPLHSEYVRELPEGINISKY